MTKNAQGLNGEQKPDVLSAEQREAIRDFVQRYAKGWWATITIFAAVMSFAAGFASDAVLSTIGRAKFTEQVQEWARAAGEARGSVDLAKTQAAKAQESAEESARKAEMAADNLSGKVNDVAKAILANPLFPTLLHNQLEGPISHLKIDGEKLVVDGALVIRDHTKKEGSVEIAVGANGGALLVSDNAGVAKIQLLVGADDTGGTIITKAGRPGIGGDKLSSLTGSDGVRTVK